MSYAAKGIIKRFLATSTPSQYDLFLDSGAFTAFTKGKAVDIDEYCDFIKETAAYWTTYAALDVIGDAEATLNNLSYMEKQGLSPLPTFHPITQRWDILEMLLRKYSYIAIGGLVGIKRKKRRALLSPVFALNCKYKKRLHGFGLTDFTLLREFPFYSVDSSSVAYYSRVGNIAGIDRVTSKRRTMAEKQEAYVAGGWLQAKADFRLSDRSTPEGKAKVKWATETLFKQALRFYKNQAEIITKLWTARGVDWAKQLGEKP